MNKSKDQNYISEVYGIPADVMLEIAQIIVQADLPHEIQNVKANKGQIIMEINHQPDLKFHQKAVENIADILKEYQELCNEETENVNWREG